MTSVPSSEFTKRFGRYKDMAQRSPVAVTSHDRIAGYFISQTDYEEYLRLKTMVTKSYSADQLPDNVLRDISNAKMDARNTHLNDLLED